MQNARGSASHPSVEETSLSVFSRKDLNSHPLFFSSVPRSVSELKELIKEGRLPISLANIKLISANAEKQTREIIGEISVDSDLTIIGFRQEQLKTEGYKLYTGYDRLGNVLFVSANKKKEIK